MAEDRWPVPGDHVIACDEVGQDYNALVTANFGNREASSSLGYGPTINVLYVSGDEAKTDQYGRQIDRHLTSLVHVGNPTTAPGRYWRWPDEARKGPVERGV